MAFASWVSILKSRRGIINRGFFHRAKSRKRVPFVNPKLEQLEDRTLLSTITWINPAGGDWDTPANWSSGSVPGAADDALINMTGITVTHGQSNADAVNSLTSQAALNLSNGSLGLGTDSSIANSFSLSGGTLAGPGDLIVSGLMTWSGGTMSGGGATAAQGGIALSGWVALDNRTLNNPGTVSWTGSGSRFDANNGAVINNTGTWDSQADQYMFNYGGRSTFNNSGTLEKSGGAGTTEIRPILTSSGSVQVTSGTLNLDGGGTSSGNFSVTAGHTLDFGDNYNYGRTLAAGSSVSGAGTVLFSGNTSDTVAGIYDITGSTVVTDAAVSFTGSVLGVGRLTLDSGTTAFSTGQPITVPSLTFNGGTLTGTDDMTIAGPFTWSGGGMGGMGGTTTAQGGIALSGWVALDNRTLNNPGTVTWTGNGSRFDANNGAVINNTGTWDSQDDQYLFNYGSRSTFNNSGTLEKSGGAGTTEIRPILTSSGSVQVTSGTLNLDGGGTSSGNFTVTAGHTLDFGDNATTLAAGSSVTGAGTLLFSGNATATIAGTYDVTGATTLIGNGAVHFTGTVLGVGDLALYGGATADFSTGQLVTLPSLTLAGGTLGGQDDLTVAGPFTWGGGWGGVVTGTGTLTAEGGIALSGHEVLDGRTLNNRSTVTWTGSGSLFEANNGAVINNTGTWDSQDDQHLVNYGAQAAFNNTGTLDKSGGTGITYVDPTLVNNGIVRPDSGTLALRGSLAINGNGILAGGLLGTLAVPGSISGDTRNADQFAPLAAVVLNGPGSAGSPQLLEVMSHDRGDIPRGFLHNFVYNTLALGNGTYVRLVDNVQNSAGTGSDALYVNTLIVPAGTTLDLGGLNVYARATQIGGTVVGGTITTLPDGGPLFLGSPAPGTISPAGEVDDWSFFGRAGQAVSVVVNTGGAGSAAPLTPYLNSAQVSLLDSAGNVLATASNSQAGADVNLLGVNLPADGTYHIQVQAPLFNLSGTGNYIVSAWDATVHQAPLNLGQTITSQLDTPYRVDRWTFAATANQQVQFNLVNETTSGIQFDLTGPAGFIGFVNLTASSGLITLPSDGTYVLTAHSAAGQTGAYAFQLDETSQTDLTLGQAYNGSLVGSGQAQLFRVNVPQEQQLLVELQDSAGTDQNELYVKFGAPPTRADYQYDSITPGASQHVIVPMAGPGTWYILVYAEGVPNPPSSFTLTAGGSTIVLDNVTPDHLGNAADALLTLTGAGFDATTTVSLAAADGTTYQANQTQLDLPTQLSATFTAGSVPAGTYTILVTRADGASASLSKAFTIDQGGQANFHAKLVVPSTMGYHIASTLYLQYSNTGDLAMPAPILEATVIQHHTIGGDSLFPPVTQSALLTLDASLATPGLFTLFTSTLPAGFSNTIQILASGATPGVLQPGESIQVPIYYAGWQGSWDFNYPPFEPEVGVEDTADTTSIAWSTLQAQFKPPQISTAAWNAMFPNLEAQIGNTWGQFVRRMDDDAAYLRHLGENVTDLSQLWAFEIQQANGFSPVPTLSTAVDASVLTPGRSLSVDRAFPNSINARNQKGPFGMGWQWTAGWQRVLTVASDGTVTITDPDGDADGALTVFEPDSRGGYFAEPGSDETLTAVNGGFLLKEKDGTVTMFGSNGFINYVQDTHGNQVNAVYTNGLLTSLTATTGQSLAFTYNSAGLISSVTDSTGRTTTYTYDTSNQLLLSVTDFAGRTTSYTYDTSGAPATANALLAVQNPNGTVEHFVYDAQGRLAQRYVDNGSSGSPTISQMRYVYGPAGKVAATDAVGGTTEYFADARGLFVKVVDPLGNATHLFYDSNYNRTQEIDAAGQIINLAYDQNGNLIKTTNPSGDVISATYSGPFNNLASSTDANGNTTRYGYNSQGDLLSITYPNGSQHQFRYDPLGNLTETINARGQAIHNAYNAMGQLTQETFADGTSLAYAYDPHGNMLSASDGTNTTTFQYDPITQDLLQVNYPGGRFLKFSYDAAGRRTQSMDQAGFTVNYQYRLGMLAGLTDGQGNVIVAYSYDAAGQLVRKDLGNGTYTTYQYDLDGNVLHLINYAPGGSVNSRFDYTYDSLGRVVSMATLDGMWTYQYDPDGRLTHAVFASTDTSVVPNQDLQYVYDPAGNRTETIINGVTTSYVTNNMNQYTQIGSANLIYDVDGNLITQTDRSGTTNYTYDELNRLTGVSSPTDISSYQYDPLGNLAAINQNGQATHYVVDPIGLGNVVGEYDASGNLVANYTYGLGLTRRVAAGGQGAYYDFDQIGSTVGMSGAGGTYQNLYRYLPFGGSITSLGTIPNAFQFVGQFGVMAEANGLHFMRARFYASAAGRFLSPDPLGLAGGQANLYTYAVQDPLALSDPLGLMACLTQEAKDAQEKVLKDELAFNEFRLQQEQAGRQWFNLVGAGLAGFVVKPAEDLSNWQISRLQDVVATLKSIIDQIDKIPSCPKPPPPPPPPPPATPCPVRKPLYGPNGDVIAYIVIKCPPKPKSQDPNAKTGPAGYGPQGFIPEDAVLPYRISFENDPTATAPAQRVVITDPLDPHIDWSTLQFTEVGFGDHLITIPAGSQHFQTTVSMTYNGQTFNVLIELALNTSTGLVTATFQTIDPTTDLPPDILTGFLPPENGTGRGEGYISYTALPRANLPTGTQIRNVATVTFDVNPPITTDQVDENDPSKGVDPAKEDLNTIDAVPPTSSVDPLPAVTTASSFTVSWSGQDDPGGSGIASFDVFVSDNGGPFTAFLTETSQTSATFTGQDGHTYAFYSVATDNAGNVQPTPAAQASTTIQTQTQAATTTTVSSDQPGGSVYGQAVSFTATVSAATGTPTGSVQFQIDGNNLGSAVTLNSGTASIDTAALPAGQHVVAAFYVSDSPMFQNSDDSASPLGQGVAPASLLVTANNQSKVYGQSNPTLTASYGGFVNGDTAGSLGGTLTLTTPATTASHAGQYPITPGGLTSTNYAITFVSGSLTVTPARLVIQADDQTKVYGAALPVLTASYFGFVNGDTAASLSTQPTLSTAATSSSHVGTYTITVSSAVDSDYTISYVTGTLTINAYAFAYQIGNDSQTYGTPANFANDLGTSINTGVNNENLSIAFSSTGDTTTAHVGSYSITATLNNGTGQLPDYSVTLQNGTLTVNPYAFTYQILNDSQTYGTLANFANDLGTTINTGVNGQNLGIAYASTGDTTTAHVGNYAITASLSNGTGQLSDYNITLQNGTLTVNPYAFTYQIANDSQTYSTPANLANDLGTSINTGVNNENLGTAYSSTGDTATAHVGSYSITATLSNGTGQLSDYSVTLQNGTLTVNPYAFTYQILNDSQTYGTAANLANDLGTTINTGVNNQNLGISYSSTGDTSTAHVQAGGYAMTGTLSNGTGQLSDYSVTLKNGTLTVNPYPFIYQIANDTEKEGTAANLAADLGATINTGVNSQNLSISYSSTGDTTTASVGTSYPITATLSDGTGKLTDYSVTLKNGTLTVVNVAPTVKITTPSLTDQVIAINTTVNFAGSFTDPGGTNETYKATWAFDSLSTAGTVTPSSTGGTVTASYAFTATGVYDVALTVSDGNGGSGTAKTDSNGSEMRVVIYDPNAGFVTGGGWITSPAGSLGPGSTVSGSSNFGFVSQYKKGSSVPSGETHFQFQVANIDFRSSSYDWLTINAVTNDAWSQFQGTGTINNKTPTNTADVYKFYISSEDGDWNGGTNVDKFRMKIWEQNASSGAVVQVIYDTQWGAPDTAGEPGITPFVDLTTKLGGGDIKLHKLNAAQVTGLGQNLTGQALTQPALAPVVQQAIAGWSAAGISTEQINILRNIPVYITDLPGAFVGMSSPDGIWIDKDAAGYGWFIDPTPADNSEFANHLSANKLAATSGSPAYGKMDLLTIIEHEMGRPLGLQETPDAPGVMAMAFQPGVRELPIASDFGLVVQSSRVGAISDLRSLAGGTDTSDIPVVGGPFAGILVSPLGVVSGDNHVLFQGLPAAHMFSDSNQAALNAVLADCTSESDFVNAVAPLLEKGLSHSLLSHSRLPSIYDMDEFWTMMAGDPLTRNSLASKETI